VTLVVVGHGATENIAGSGSADMADISVFQVGGNRLQITADVDSEGLAKLKKVLDQYEQILKLLK
jgi:hypothetical protein